METQLALDIEGVDSTTIMETVRGIQEDQPESDIHITEPEGALPPVVTDALLVVIAINATLQSTDLIIRKLRGLASKHGGDLRMIDIEPFSREYLKDQENLELVDLVLSDKRTTESATTLEFESSDGIIHRVTVDRHNPSIDDIEYEEIN